MHVLACFMVLALHICQKSGLGAIGEFLLAGLILFFIVAGYLVGFSNADINRRWLAKKAKRILLPYYILVIPILVLYYLFANDEFDAKSCSYILCNLQGINYVIYTFSDYKAMAGFGHLWYVTIIMICFVGYCVWRKYLNSPFAINPKVLNIAISLFIIAFMFLVAVPLFLTFGITLIYVFSFVMGLLFGKVWSCDYIKVKRGLFASTMIMILATVARLGGGKLIDGTLFYDRYLAPMSNLAWAMFIFFLIFYVGNRNPRLINSIASSKIVTFLDNITYEIYLTHYFILCGVWSARTFVDDLWMSNFFVVIFSLVFAYVLHQLVNSIHRFTRKYISEK